MQVEMIARTVHASLLVAGWGEDANDDGQFSAGETAIGLGFDPTGVFRIQLGGQAYLSTGFSYQADRWYRLSLTWSNPSPNGDRVVQLFARDLVSGLDLNRGSSILSLPVGPAEFACRPMHWVGVGCLAADGLVDNIQVTPPGYDAWGTHFYPTLAGGPLDDEDGDGMANALEFAFGLNPLVANPGTDLPQPTFSGGNAIIRFTPRAVQPGTLYHMEWSNDLVEWTTVSGVLSGDELTFTIPTPDDAMFFRHRVTVGSKRNVGAHGGLEK